MTDDVPRGIFYDRGGNTITFDEWAALVESVDYARVRRDSVLSVTVSTLWFGVALSMHPGGQPLFFETMVFPWYTVYARYPTEAAAIEGHHQAISWVQLKLEKAGSC